MSEVSLAPLVNVNGELKTLVPVNPSPITSTSNPMMQSSDAGDYGGEKEDEDQGHEQSQIRDRNRDQYRLESTVVRKLLEDDPVAITELFEDLDDTTDIGWLLKTCHILYWGNGFYWPLTLSCSLALFAVACSFISTGLREPNKMELVPIFVALVVEEVTNMIYGYQFLQNKGIDQVILSTKNLALREKWLVWLRRCYYLSLFCATFNLSKQMFDPASWDRDKYDADDNFGDNSRGVYFFVNLIQLYCFTMNYYMLGIWCWVCWAQYDFFRQEMFPLFTESAIKSNLVQSEMFKFLDRISYYSKKWSTNHIIRTITGVIITVGNMIMLYKNVENEQWSLAWQHSTFICTYYCSVWLTFIIAGYVNDSISKMSRQRLADMMMETKDTEFKREVLYFLHALDATNRGFTVGGVTMHIEKAMTAGSLILTIVVAVVKIHSGGV